MTLEKHWKESFRS